MASPLTQIFYNTVTASLLIQTLKKEAAAAEDLGDGFNALGVWLSGWARRLFADECQEWQKRGHRKPPFPNAWAWRSRWCEVGEGLPGMSSEEMALVYTCLEKGLSPLSPVFDMPCDALELTFRLGIPNLFQALVSKLSQAEAVELGERVVVLGNDERWPWVVWAAQQYDCRFLNALLKQGVPAKVLTEKGETALPHAKASQSINLLLDAGLSFCDLSGSGRSALVSLLAYDKFLRQDADIPIHGPEGRVIDLVLGMARFKRHEAPIEKATAIAQGFQKSGVSLPNFMVKDQGKEWPLATYYARQSLLEGGRVQQALPMIVVAAEQGWFSSSSPSTVRGWPDRGWLFLSLLYRLASDSAAGTPDDILAMGTRIDGLIGKGFGVQLGERWWENQEMIDEAIIVTQKLALKKHPLKTVKNAWAAWFKRTCHAWRDGGDLSESVACKVLVDISKAGISIDQVSVTELLQHCPDRGAVRLVLLKIINSQEGGPPGSKTSLVSRLATNLVLKDAGWFTMAELEHMLWEFGTSFPALGNELRRQILDRQLPNAISLPRRSRF